MSAKHNEAPKESKGRYRDVHGGCCFKLFLHASVLIKGYTDEFDAWNARVQINVFGINRAAAGDSQRRAALDIISVERRNNHLPLK
jgi:hypothetical protein